MGKDFTAIINKEHIVSLSVYYPKLWITSIGYRKYYSKGDKVKTGLFSSIIATEDLYSNNLGSNVYTISEIQKDNEYRLDDFSKETTYYDENGIIWVKPYVDVLLVTGKTIPAYFDTVEDCKNFITKFKEANPNFLKRNLE